MDPNATLDDMISAILRGDMATADDHFLSLNEWIAKGGFLPSDPRR